MNKKIEIVGYICEDWEKKFYMNDTAGCIIIPGIYKTVGQFQEIFCKYISTPYKKIKIIIVEVEE
jgi:peptide deformylase